MNVSKSVTVLPARKQTRAKNEDEENARLRVAAYCRVSTDSDEQATSYEAQIEHYTSYINNHPDWAAGIYADEYNLRLIQFDTETAVKPHKITALGAKRQTESRYFCFMEI